MPNPKGINQYTGKGGGKSKSVAKGVRKTANQVKKEQNSKFGLSNAQMLKNAAAMFGTNSAQYRAAQKKFG